MKSRIHTPTGAADLHRRAATWMTGQNDPVGAIGQWILAGDEQEAGRILLQVLPKMLTPEGPALAAAIRPLAAAAAATPSLSTLVASASWHYHRHEFAAMSRDALEAKNFLDQATNDVRPGAEVVISLFEMVAARNNADTAAVAELAGRVIDLIDHMLPRGAPRGTRLPGDRAGQPRWGASVERQPRGGARTPRGCRGRVIGRTYTAADAGDRPGGKSWPPR